MSEKKAKAARKIEKPKEDKKLTNAEKLSNLEKSNVQLAEKYQQYVEQIKKLQEGMAQIQKQILLNTGAIQMLKEIEDNGK